MTYPDDVLKAAREAVAKCWEGFSGEDAAEDEHFQEMAELCRAGEWDQQIEVQAACIAIMAERERAKNG